MTQRSFNTETGWYHEARQAFVPEGPKAFVFLKVLKMSLEDIFSKLLAEGVAR
jgi:hypothetical protein